ncbi:MAG: helix-turn-helix transcriptional regulator [Alphaproteobacteria bacterium]
MVALRDSYGISNAVYHAVNVGPMPYAALTYSPEWMQYYHDQKFVQVDPVVKGALTHFHPMDWKQLDWSDRGSRGFLGEAIAAGVCNQGLSVPIRGPNGQFALFTINDNTSDDSWEKFSKEYKRDMMLISHYIHRRVVEIIAPEDPQNTQKLSPRETDSLRYLSLGYSRGQISEKLAISEHTLRVYIDSARHKLGALNAIHAVTTAFSRGLISF